LVDVECSPKGGGGGDGGEEGGDQTYKYKIRGKACGWRKRIKFYPVVRACGGFTWCRQEAATFIAERRVVVVEKCCCHDDLLDIWI